MISSSVATTTPGCLPRVVVLKAGIAALGMVVAEETGVVAADKAAANDPDLTLIHPSAWKRNSAKSISKILYGTSPLADEHPSEASLRTSFNHNP
jgi:hypothetical protein